MTWFPSPVSVLRLCLLELPQSKIIDTELDFGTGGVFVDFVQSAKLEHTTFDSNEMHFGQ